MMVTITPILSYTILILSLISPLVHAWSTSYDLQLGKVYMHLLNNDIISIPFDITGKNLTIENGDSVTTLTTPPKDSSIFLFNQQLFAILPNKSSSSSLTDTCGKGFLSASKFNNKTNTWDDYSLDLLQISSDASFYEDATYLVPFVNSNNSSEVYVYGGYCSATQTVLGRLVLIDLESGLVLNITTSTQPQSFYGAANLAAPDPQNQLIIGGKSSGGWLSLLQLATWKFTSGWSLEIVSSAQTAAITLRKNSLALPVFYPLANNTIYTIESTYEVKSVVLLGGDLNSGEDVDISVLNMETNNWIWTNTTSEDVDTLEILGAATIFNTLIVVNSTGVSLVSNSKRDGDNTYKLNLYSTQNYQKTQSLQKNTDKLMALLVNSVSGAGTSSINGRKSNSLSVSQKAIIGTIVPLASIAIIVAAGLFVYKRKKSEKSYNSEEFGDYQLGVYGDNRHINHDSNSTIGEQSMDVWVRKRQEFDRQRSQRHFSFHESLETLSDVKTELTISDPFENSHLPLRNEISGRDTGVSSTPVAEVLPSHSMSRKFKKSLSFNTLNSNGSGNVASYSLLNKQKSKLLRFKNSPSLFDDEFAYDLEEEDKNSEVDDQVDVQVLVSSKRTLVLRVVNPDLETIHSEAEDVSTIISKPSEAQIRQRVPSGPSFDN